MTDAGPAALIELAARGVPFALIARDATTVELLTGDVVDVELLADIPLDRLGRHPPGGARARAVPASARARLRVPRRWGSPALPRGSGSRGDRPARCPRAAALRPDRPHRRGVRHRRRGLRADRASGDRRRDRTRRGRELRDPAGFHRGSGHGCRHRGPDLVPRPARARARRVLDLRRRDAGPRRRGREPGGPRERSGRHRDDEPDFGHVPSSRGRGDRRGADGVPGVDQRDRRAVHGRGRRAQDDERGLLRRRAHHRSAPEGDVASHPHRVRPARTQPAGSSRHPARDDVRTDGDRLPHAERVHGDHAPRDHSARVLLRRRGAVHAAHRRDPRRRVHARPRCADPHPHCLPARRQAACTGRRHSRAPLRPVRRGERDPRQSRRRPGGDRRGPPWPSGGAASGRCEATRSTRMPRRPTHGRSRTTPTSRRCSPRATPGSPPSG